MKSLGLRKNNSKKSFLLSRAHCFLPAALLRLLLEQLHLLRVGASAAAVHSAGAMLQSTLLEKQRRSFFGLTKIQLFFKLTRTRTRMHNLWFPCCKEPGARLAFAQTRGGSPKRLPFCSHGMGAGRKPLFWVETKHEHGKHISFLCEECLWGRLTSGLQNCFYMVFRSSSATKEGWPLSWERRATSSSMLSATPQECTSIAGENWKTWSKNFSNTGLHGTIASRSTNIQWTIISSACAGCTNPSDNRR